MDSCVCVGGLDEWMSWMDGQTDRWTDACVCVDGLGEWMYWMDGWMDEHAYVWMGWVNG
jgi:hypothetical protein